MCPPPQSYGAPKSPGFIGLINNIGGEKKWDENRGLLTVPRVTNCRV